MLMPTRCVLVLYGFYRMRPGIRWALPHAPEGRLENLVEAAKAHIDSKVEHSFRVIQTQLAGGHSSSSAFKTRGCSALAKNRCKIIVLAALTNLFLVRRQ